jgi:SAM-dependent methyltransferase
VTVLLHLPPAAKRRAVAEAARVLAPGGSALLIESTWDDPAEHVFGQPVEAWRVLWEQAGLRLAHLSGHCFILGRRALRPNGKVGDFAALCLDYPLDYLLMAANRGRRSALALQHVMVFTRPAGAGA